MAINKVINSQSQEFQPVLTDTLVLDAVPTVNSFNSVTSDAVARAVAGASGDVPAVTESDNGKVLTAVYDEGGAAVEWADAASGVPAAASADEGKVLGVTDNQGSVGWVSQTPAQVNADWNAASGAAQILNKPTIPTVDQVYGSSSANAQSGVAVAGAIATVNQVPTVGSSDNNKVLKATYSGGTGSFAWADAPASVTVDQTYNASSTNAQSGTAVAGAIATVNQVPASTSADEDKVLTVNSSGTPVWAAAQGGGGSSYTAGDGIAISGLNAISAKVGYGLEIGSYPGSAVTANMSATAYRAGSEPYLSYVMPLTSDLVNKIETSGISVTLSKVANADWYCFDANSNSFPVILKLTPTVGGDYGTRLVLSNTGYSIVNNILPAGVAYDFNLDDINTSMSNITWATIKANPTNYALSFIHSSRWGYGIIYNGGNSTLSDSTSYTTGSYSYAVMEQGYINVSVPVPSFNTSTDDGKVLTVTNSALRWDAIPQELPSITGNSSKLLAVNSGATGVEWVDNQHYDVLYHQLTTTVLDGLWNAWRAKKQISCWVAYIEFNGSTAAGSLFTGSNQGIWLPLCSVIDRGSSEFRWNFYLHDGANKFSLVLTCNEDEWSVGTPNVVAG